MERPNRPFGKALLLLLPFILPEITKGHLGETSSQFADRYGHAKGILEPIGTASPFLKNAQARQYEQDDWVIIAGFPDLLSPALRLEYRKKDYGSLSKEEITTLLRANCAGMTWHPISPYTPTGKSVSTFDTRKWKRDDGATALFQGNKLLLNSPEAAAYEKREIRPRLTSNKSSQSVREIQTMTRRGDSSPASGSIASPSNLIETRRQDYIIPRGVSAPIPHFGSVIIEHDHAYVYLSFHIWQKPRKIRRKKGLHSTSSNLTLLTKGGSTRLYFVDTIVGARKVQLAVIRN